MNANADADEIARFDNLAATWWDSQGAMAPLHVINPVRLRYIVTRVGSLNGLKVADIGCGGGILSEALATAGADVTGIDLAQNSIDVARKHADDAGLDINYQVISAEALAEEHAQAFDLVCCMEMLEHVPDPGAVLSACAALTRAGGDLIFSTINRNAKSFMLMIAGAEYALNLLPRGTHEYAKFIKPSEMDRWARQTGLETRDVCGMRYNPVLKSASLHPRDVAVNYLIHCRKSPIQS